jgi:hypothetical protein
MFLRDYVDKLYYRYKPDKRKRKRVHEDNEYASNETAAPLNAPRWTKSGYNGTMHNLITEAIRKDESDDFILPLTSASQDLVHDLALVDITSGSASQSASQSTMVQEPVGESQSTMVQEPVGENQEQQAETSENENNK